MQTLLALCCLFECKCCYFWSACHIFLSMRKKFVHFLWGLIACGIAVMALAFVAISAIATPPPLSAVCRYYGAYSYIYSSTCEVDIPAKTNRESKVQNAERSISSKRSTSMSQMERSWLGLCGLLKPIQVMPAALAARAPLAASSTTTQSRGSTRR